MAKNLKEPKGEGETPLDDLSGLRVRARTRSQVDTLEFKNNVKAYEKYLIQQPVSPSALFTVRGLLKVHQEMLGDVWDWAGERRKTEKNLGAAPGQIGSEINRFLFDFHQWEEEGRPPIEVSCRIHHRLVAIHPFENGNGRWARMVANLYLHGKGEPIVQWPNDPRLVREVFKPIYLTALKSADGGDYEPLVKLHRQYSESTNSR